MTKAMYIGLSPDYKYPGTFEKWFENNTRYASNHGACLISRAIGKEFNADYIDDFSNISELNRQYDVCFIALATHIHAYRDISYYVDVIEKLDMKVVAFSLGVEDYIGGMGEDYSLHPSVIRFLEVVSSKSKLIGVRGHYTASLLYRAGFSNVLAIGCPTVYSNQKPSLKINKKPEFESALCVYQSSMAEHLPHLLKGPVILGQDFQDQVTFTNELDDDKTLKSAWDSYYDRVDPNRAVRHCIEERGTFPDTFETWDSIIGQHDFVYGPRLHANVAALLKGIPAVMFARDLRVREIAEFYDLPYITYDEAKKLSVQEIYQKVDFERFSETYEMRYQNFLYFLRQNEVEHSFEGDQESDFSVNGYDERITRYLSAQGLNKVGQTNLTHYKWKSRLARVSRILTQGRS